MGFEFPRWLLVGCMSHFFHKMGVLAQIQKYESFCTFLLRREKQDCSEKVFSDGDFYKPVFLT